MQRKRAARSQCTYVVYRFEDPKTVLHQVNDMLLSGAIDDKHGYIPQPLKNAVLNEEADLERTGQHTESEDVTGLFKPRFHNCHCKTKPVSRESYWQRVERAINQLVTDDLSNLFEEMLDNISRLSYHKAQQGIWSLVSNVVQQLMQDALCEIVMNETLVRRSQNVWM